MSDLCKEELSALARVTELYEEICSALGEADLCPGGPLQIDSLADLKSYGTVGHNQDGDIVFMPAEAKYE